MEVAGAAMVGATAAGLGGVEVEEVEMGSEMAGAAETWLDGEAEASLGDSAKGVVAPMELAAVGALMSRAVGRAWCAAWAAAWHGFFLGFSGFFWLLLALVRKGRRVRAGRSVLAAEWVLKCCCLRFLLVFLLVFLIKLEWSAGNWVDGSALAVLSMMPVSRGDRSAAADVLKELGVGLEQVLVLVQKEAPPFAGFAMAMAATMTSVCARAAAHPRRQSGVEEGVRAAARSTRSGRPAEGSEGDDRSESEDCIFVTGAVFSY